MMKYDKKHVTYRGDLYIRWAIHVYKVWELDYYQCMRAYHAGYKRALKEMKEELDEQK